MGLLSTFGNPFCGYDSLNVQTITNDAVISENTDIINIDDLGANVFLPSGLETKVLLVFLHAEPYAPNEVLFFHEGEDQPIIHTAYRNSIFNLVRFNGEWFISNPGGEGSQ